MKKIACAAMLMLFAGCVEETSREQVGEPTISEGMRSCFVAGYCFRVGMNAQGKMSYGYGFSTMCQGTQMATEKTTIFKVTYSDGSTKLLPHNETIYASSCQQ